MTFDELATYLANHHINVGLKLTVDAPAGALTDEVRAALAEHKPHVVARVASAMQREALSSWTWGEGSASGTPPF